MTPWGGGAEGGEQLCSSSAVAELVHVTSGKAFTPALFLVGLCAAAALFDRLGMVSERVPVVVGACMFLCFGGQHQAPKCNPKATWGKSHPRVRTEQSN